jgi:hypothetical protein
VRHAAEYVLPLKRHDLSDRAGLAELTAYLERLSALVEDVTVVDGSAPALFAAHAAAWQPMLRQGRLRHLAPDRPAPGPGGAPPPGNGKVDGVVTGVRHARHRRVVLADDDVRYDAGTLAGLLDRLAGTHLVRPQNVLRPPVWHARWDTARSLVNRAAGHDHPGTYALDRNLFLATGGYARDVLFENLELERTVRAAGGRVADAPDLYVTRLPPSTRRFLEQRPRQAYDSLAQPGRMLVELALLPGLVTAARRSVWAPLAAAAAAVAVAETGRRRHGGRAAFPATAALWAPAWACERAVCAWVALAARAGGGMPYCGRRLRTAAHAEKRLRAAVAARSRGGADELSRSGGTPSAGSRPPCP